MCKNVTAPKLLQYSLRKHSTDCKALAFKKHLNAIQTKLVNYPRLPDKPIAFGLKFTIITDKMSISSSQQSIVITNLF